MSIKQGRLPDNKGDGPFCFGGQLLVVSVKKFFWGGHQDMKNIVDFIYRLVTGSRHIRIILTPIFAALFLFLVLLTIFFALKVDDAFHFYGHVRYPLELHSFLAAPCNWCFSVDMVSPAFYKSEWNPRTGKPTPQTCQYRSLRIRKKSDADRRIFYFIRGWIYCRIPITFVCFCPVVCGLQYS